MSRYSNSGTKANHAKLSFWSRQSIREILLDQRMSYCLHPMDTPFCGDGVVQEGEVRKSESQCAAGVLNLEQTTFFHYHNVKQV